MDAKTRTLVRLFLAGRKTGADIANTLGAKPSKALLLEVAEMMELAVSKETEDEDIYQAIADGVLKSKKPVETSDKPASEPTEYPDLSTMTKAELVDYAQSENIKVRSSMTKSEMVDAIKAAIEGAK